MTMTLRPLSSGVADVAVQVFNIASHFAYYRVSNTLGNPGYPGNLFDFFLLEILEFYWNLVRSAGDFTVLYSLLRLI